MTQNNPRQTGIWIDGSKAIIVHLGESAPVVKEIAADIDNPVHHQGQGKHGTFMGTHHVNDEKKFDERRKHQVARFLDEVLDNVQDRDELMVMGPSGLKIELRSRIESDKRLMPKLKGTMPAEHLTINQCVAQVKSFFAAGIKR